MSIATGVDLIDIARFAGIYARYGQRLLDHIFLPSEQQYCQGRVRELAVRFAVKEAVAKSLGTGFRQGVGWKDIEVVSDALKKPSINLHGAALLRAEQLGLSQFAVSMSHERNMGIAFVVASGSDLPT